MNRVVGIGRVALARLLRLGDSSSLAARFADSSFEPGIMVKGDRSRLQIGPASVVQTGVVLHLGGMDWCGRTGHISIGARAVLSPHVVIYGAGSGGVEIGDDFDCGPGVGIFSSRTDYQFGPNNHVFAPVRIGNRVVVFANAVISPGVTVGDGAAIAAGSVVTHDVAANTLVGGTPARKLRTLRD